MNKSNGFTFGFYSCGQVNRKWWKLNGLLNGAWAEHRTTVCCINQQSITDQSYYQLGNSFANQQRGAAAPARFKKHRAAREQLSEDIQTWLERVCKSSQKCTGALARRLVSTHMSRMP